MFVSHSKVVSLLLAIMTMITWGTNKIAVKYLTYPVSLYTIDFFVWVFIFHTILSLTLGARWFPGDNKDAFSNIIDIIKSGVKCCFLASFVAISLLETIGRTVCRWCDHHGLHPDYVRPCRRLRPDERHSPSLWLLHAYRRHPHLPDGAQGQSVAHFHRRWRPVLRCGSEHDFFQVRFWIPPSSCSMNQKCQKKKMEEEAAQKAQAANQTPAPSDATSAVATSEPATAPATESADTVTVPLIEEEPKKLVRFLPPLHRSCP